MLAPHISVVNLGCRVNRVESDRITADLMRLGFAIVEPQVADLIVINTCAVTGEAEAKTRKAVRHALAYPNEPFVLVTGCVVNLPNVSVRCWALSPIAFPPAAMARWSMRSVALAWA